jgi:hypothetical protein
MTSSYGNTTFEVKGKFFSKGNCTKPIQLFVSLEKNLLYQLEVPINGTFSLQLVKGDYTFRASNKEACEGLRSNFQVNKNIKNLIVEIKREKI